MSIRVFDAGQSTTDRCVWLVSKSTALRMAGDREDPYPLTDYKWVERKAIQRCSRLEMQERRQIHADVARELRARESNVAWRGEPMGSGELPGIKFVLNGRTPQKFLYSETLQEFTARQCWADWAAVGK